MAKTLLDLASDMDAKAATLPQAVSTVVQNTANAVLTELVERTPVDTSQALSSWIVTLDQPSATVGKAHFVGSRGSTQSQSADKTIADGQLVIASRQPGQPIFITNNQPYIQALDAGTISKQPGAFVALAMLAGRRLLRKAKLIW